MKNRWINLLFLLLIVLISALSYRLFFLDQTREAARLMINILKPLSHLLVILVLFVILRSLVKRGLRGVRLAISDAHEGLTKAIQKVLSGASWQRCRVTACKPRSFSPYCRLRYCRLLHCSSWPRALSTISCWNLRPIQPIPGS